MATGTVTTNGRAKRVQAKRELALQETREWLAMRGRWDSPHAYNMARDRLEVALKAWLDAEDGK